MTTQNDFAPREDETPEQFQERVERQNIERREALAEQRRRTTAPRQATAAELEFPDLTESELRQNLEQGGLSAEDAQREAARIIASKPSGPGDAAARSLREQAARAETPAEREAKIKRAEELEARAAGIPDTAVKEAQRTAEKRRAVRQEAQERKAAADAEKERKQAKQAEQVAGRLAKEGQERAKSTPAQAPSLDQLRRATAQNKLRSAGFAVKDGFDLTRAVQFARSPNNVHGITPQMLEDAGFTRAQIREAESRIPTQAELSARAAQATTVEKQIAALQRIDRFKDKDGRYDLNAALDAGVSQATLDNARFSKADIREAVKVQRAAAESKLTASEKTILRDAGMTAKEIDVLGQVRAQFSASTIAVGAGSVAAGSAASPIPGSRLITAAALLVAIAASAKLVTDVKNRREATRAFIGNFQTATKGLPKDASLPKGIKASLVAMPGRVTGSPPLVPVTPPPLTTTTPGETRKGNTRVFPGKDDAADLTALPGFDIIKADPKAGVMTAQIGVLDRDVEQDRKVKEILDAVNRQRLAGVQELLDSANKLRQEAEKIRRGIKPRNIGDRISTSEQRKTKANLGRASSLEQQAAELERKAKAKQRQRQLARENVERRINGSADAIRQQVTAKNLTNARLRQLAIMEAAKILVASGGASQLPQSINQQVLAAAILAQTAILLKEQAVRATRQNTKPVVTQRKTEVLRVPKSLISNQTRTFIKPATVPAIKEALRSAVATKTTTALRVSAGKTTRSAAKVSTAAKAIATTAATTKPATATRLSTQPATATKATTRARTATATTAARRPLAPPFRLPGGAVLARGRYPRVVTWKQGFTRITVDLDTGRRQTRRADSPGAPRATFRVISTDKTPPKARVFDLGFENIVVTGNGIRFRLERSKLRGKMPRPRMGRR